jgi:hypothetical protein
MVASASQEISIAISVISIALIFFLIVSKRKSSRVDIEEAIEKYEDMAAKILSELGPLIVLIKMLGPVYEDELSVSRPIASRKGGNLMLLPMINAWTVIEQEARNDVELAGVVQDAIDLAEQHVRVINDFAQLVDVGLVSPRHFFRVRSDLHLQLMIETTLLEPFTWQQAVVDGRGRWGMRIAELSIILRRLSACSDSHDLTGDVDIRTTWASAKQPSALLLSRAGIWSRIYLRIRFSELFYVASITRRTKLQQNDFADHLALKLGVSKPPGKLATQW